MRMNIISALAALALGACATTEPSKDINVVMDEDGNIVGIESEDPAMTALLESVLTQQKSTGDALEESEIWQDDGDDNFRHIQSGGLCPEKWGSFTRSSKVIYKQDGSDVGCGYESAELYTAVTFYFYKNGEPIEQEFDGVMGLIKNRTPAHKDAAFTNLAPSSTSGFSYLAGAIDYKNTNGATLRSAALLTQKDGWRLKMRVTYPADYAPEIETTAVTMLLGQFDVLRASGTKPKTSEDEKPAEQKI